VRPIGYSGRACVGTFDALEPRKESIMTTCRFCGRDIVDDGRAWVDPEATGDDSIWRETCDSSHETREAYHEPPIGYGESVSTWADGFGRWHARVTFPEPGYGPQYLDASIARIRAKARRAIIREVLARESVDYRCRVEVVEHDQDSLNRMHSITYAERG
jgi:hypothetical protein